MRLFFFFQAEDGIRDYKVTGVQTCALPICGREAARDIAGVLDHLERPAIGIEDGVVAGLDPDLAAVLADAQVLARIVLAAGQLAPELRIFGAVAFIDRKSVV